MTERLLDFLLTYGVTALVPLLLVGAVGVPLPGTLLLLAAGAFAGGGQLALVPLLLGASGATFVGNGVGYWLGRRGGKGALGRWGRRFRMGAAAIERAEGFFGRYGGMSVLFSRFPFSPLSAIVNILAGAAHYPMRSFLLANLAGVSVWTGVYVGLGYIFGASWEMIAAVTSGVTQALTLGLISLLLLFFVVRAIRQHHDHDHEKDGEAVIAPGSEGSPEEPRVGA